MIAELTFDPNVYALDAIKKAAYRNLNRFSTQIEIKDSGILCKLSFKEKISEEKIKQFIEDFKDDVLDQDLRETIKSETENIRNLILAHTFSKTGLVKDE